MVGGEVGIDVVLVLSALLLEEVEAGGDLIPSAVGKEEDIALFPT